MSFQVSQFSFSLFNYITGGFCCEMYLDLFSKLSHWRNIFLTVYVILQCKKWRFAFFVSWSSRSQMLRNMSALSWKTPHSSSFPCDGGVLILTLTSYWLTKQMVCATRCKSCCSAVSKFLNKVSSQDGLLKCSFWRFSGRFFFQQTKDLDHVFLS